MTAFPPSHTGRKYGYHTFRSPFYFPNNTNLLLASTIDDFICRAKNNSFELFQKAVSMVKKLKRNPWIVFLLFRERWRVSFKERAAVSFN